jgi:hypothetical protein
MSDLKTSKTYNILEFVGWYQREELILSPKYQRNAVWNLNAKSYLIDTILNGLPIPPVFIRQKVDINLQKTIKEVLDGQQRLRAIFEFYNNEFKILPSQSEEYGGLNYSSLPGELKEQFSSYELSVEIIKINDEATIYDMFARLNSNNMTLNKQEIRNAKYWGNFKVFINKMAKKYKFLFISIHTFSITQLARMQDLELLSSLTILTIDGIVSEKTATIDNYYKKYDSEFIREEEVQKKISFILNTISKLYDDDEQTTNFFHRKVWFYTLFAIILNQIYGIPNFSIERINSLNYKNINKNINKFKLAMNELESRLERFNDGGLSDKEKLAIAKIFDLHKSRTTSQIERKERVKILNKIICEIMNG